MPKQNKSSFKDASQQYKAEYKAPTFMFHLFKYTE